MTESLKSKTLTPQQQADATFISGWVILFADLDTQTKGEFVEVACRLVRDLRMADALARGRP